MKDNITTKAKEFIKKHKKEICTNFVNDKITPSVKTPFSFFMAGSIGAGKPEFAKNLIKLPRLKAIRIDADEIKEFIPYYNGRNANKIQGASALGVEYIHDHVLAKKKNMIMDGTFSNYKIAYKNIQRSLKRKRPVEIFYIYQDPILAWQFAKAREHEKGRKVTKKAFIDSFFNSLKTTNRIKNDFEQNIKLHLIIKSYEHSLDNFNPNIDNLEQHLKIEYTKTALKKLL